MNERTIGDPNVMARLRLTGRLQRCDARRLPPSVNFCICIPTLSMQKASDIGKDTRHGERVYRDQKKANDWKGMFRLSFIDVIESPLCRGDVVFYGCITLLRRLSRPCQM